MSQMIRTAMYSCIWAPFVHSIWHTTWNRFVLISCRAIVKLSIYKKSTLQRAKKFQARIVIQTSDLISPEPVSQNPNE